MAECTIFRNFTVPVKNETLNDIATIIASDKYKSIITRIRYLSQSNETKEAADLKMSLPAFTPSATFTDRRINKCVDKHSGFIHLDFDNLPGEEVEQTFSKICEADCSFLCFRSPSGAGLKVFVRVDTDIKGHDFAYKQVQDFYEKLLGIKSDRKCKDITRLCFFSYDPHLYINLTSELFEIRSAESNEKFVAESNTNQGLSGSEDWFEMLEECEKFTQQKERYENRNRNNYIYYLASNANRNGIPEQATLSFCLTRYDLDKNRIKSAVKSAYTHHQYEFAKFAKAAKSAIVGIEQPDVQEDYLKSTPKIPCTLYENMPQIIQKGARAFNDERERDVFLTSALAVLSGSISNVKGLYDGNEVYPNLYSFCVAPPASGKGALKFAKMLGDKYHDNLVMSSREAEKMYLQEMEIYKTKKQAAKKSRIDLDQEPEKPSFKILFIPANTSYAKVLLHIEQNKGVGIICETEADTMGNTFKQDWGGYSDMLRKAFHHDRISSSRKTNNEYIEVDQPRLSVSLTGTPGQVAGLIASSEDGLFSRFIFYTFKANQLWKNVSPAAGRMNLTTYFKELSEEVHQMILFLEEHNTVIELSQEQWNKINDFGKSKLLEVSTFTSESASSVVKRLGLITYRICMLFTAMRKVENAECTESMMCTNTDFDIAIQLAEIYLNHSVLMFNNLPRQTTEIYFKGGNNKRNFYKALPNEFTRHEAIEISKRFDMSTRSVDELLKNLLDGYLTQPKTGFYQKQSRTP